MRRLEIITTVLICCVIYAFNCYGETQKLPEGNSIKQQKEIVPEQSQAEEKFNPAECFDKVWQIINEEFWDPNFNGVDWEDAGKRYKPKALAAKDHESFAVIVNQMLAELKTSHTYYYTKWNPDYYTLQAALISGELRENNTSDTSILEKHLPELYSSQANPHRTGIGVVTKKLNGRYYVNTVLASSPAERAGIVLGDWIVEVNGRPFHPFRSFQNKAGQEVELTIQRGLSESTRHTIKVTPLDMKERELFESDTQASMKIIEHKGRRFSYIRLWWLMGWKMRGAFEVGLMDHDTEGIIIDIRDGFGGSPATEYIHPFLKGGLEITQEYITRNRTGRSSVPDNRPVIVLTNGGSRSGKELLSYYFKKTKRGLLIGERTAGYVCGGSYKRISEESMLLYGASMLIVDGKRLEGIGVEPDIEVPFDIRFAAGKDIQLERAMDEMVKLIEVSS
ncbi:MAG: S41 family peptidase [Planctomycetota bacterium]|jgi:carboxyl-terminal processing protease